MSPLADYLSPLPLIAVLRGITPDEIAPIAEAIHGEGFRVLEVPLNSPRPFDSIARLAAE
jgi:2-dehydro-3-deoxyphosphogalactonate aldolase